MGKFAGGFLRVFSTVIYGLAFGCAAVALGIFSYFLAKLSIHHLPIANRWRAVEGLTGAAVLYTVFAVILTCFLGGSTFFGILGLVLDILFCGAFIAVAILTRHGDSSCSGIVNTPLGVGPANLQRAGTHLRYACRLNTAVFAVAIIGAFLFAIAAILHIFMMRNHQKEKKYGPGPSNNYTSGYGSRFFKRKPKVTKDAYGNRESTELGGVGATGTAVPASAAHDTAYTSTTGHTGTAYTGSTMTQDQYGTATSKYDAPHSGYHTGPTGQSVNPYGYNNNATAVNY